MAVTDLTGTKWKLNNTISRIGSTAKYFELSLQITSDSYSISLPYTVNSYTYTKLYLGGTNSTSTPVFKVGVYGGGSSGDGYFITYYNAGDSYYSSGWGTFSNSGWRYSTYNYSPSVALNDDTPIISDPIITITGGTDTTNETLISWLEANATQILPTSFKHYYKNTTLIGTGTYKFRPYTVIQPQLSTPVNVSADGTTVSWDEVENATSYEILADGTSIGEVNN